MAAITGTTITASRRTGRSLLLTQECRDASIHTKKGLIMFGSYTYPDHVRGRSLAIFGAGEFGRIAWNYFEEDSPYTVLCHIVDDDYLDTTEATGHRPVQSLSNFVSNLTPQDTDVFVALSARELSARRIELVSQFRQMGYFLASYVSSRAFVDASVSIGSNVFVFEQNSIQSGAHLADSVVLWSGNHIGHLSSIGTGTFISSHVVVAGDTRVDERCYFGINSSVRDGISVGPRTVLGASSYLSRSTPGDCVLFGNPAKVLPGAHPLKAIK